ncbi:MAG: bifunctional methylenetetrahydrofolate dehydrogenase/methenyltetrahydrofolate cyclohydrolase FolD [Acidiferrobacteraceae bacterium]|nr:bifunctional methylenetetrahydrofolate dehydrogenase/methenyltetrahydrofolate cyclohydrolase FolD [Acidiferrobacteraceae bacterium]|tara:strand:+ start:373 stop:1251 length:879 start_codon:yes stop_codon:yes gene_type:complete
MAELIDGRSCAEELRTSVSDHVSDLKINHAITPGLAVVLVGEDPASQVYVRNKKKQTIETGMKSYDYHLDENVGERQLLDLIDELNSDPHVHGILVQLPLPDSIDSHAVINAIDPMKDVDGFHLRNVGLLSTGNANLVPCTPLGCMMLLKRTCEKLSGMNSVVVGRSNIVGKPMAALLLAENCTVTIGHSRTKNLPDVCREADILVAAVGRAEMITGEWVKPGAVVIDVGINRIDGKHGKTRLVGDVEFESVSMVASAITPVPGGVGPMTIACLLRNTVQAACAINNLPFNL